MQYYYIIFCKYYIFFLQIFFLGRGIITENERNRYIFLQFSAFANKKYKIVLPARASFWYTAAAALERGVGFIFTPLFTRLLTAEEYGLYPLYTSFMGLFTVFITLELSGNIIYRGISKFRGREREFMRACLGVMSLSALIFGAALAAFGTFFVRLTGLSVPILSFLVIQVYLNGIVNLYTARERYYYRYRAAILPNFIISTLSPALAFIMIRFFGVGAPSRIYAYLVITIAIAIPLAAAIMQGGVTFSREVLRFVVRASLPLLPHFIAVSVSAQAGRAIVGVFRGEGELAVYSVVFSMGFIFSLISGGISSSLSPWISRKLSHGGADILKIHKATQRIVAPLCILTLISLCFSREALLVLAPPGYQQALGALFPIAISVLLSFISTVQAAIILYYDGTVTVSAASVAVALVNLSLNLLLTPVYGYMASAFIQAAGSLLLVLVGSVGIRMRAGVSLSYARHIIPIIISAAVCALIFAMSESFSARLLLAIALILLLITQLNKIKWLISDK